MLKARLGRNNKPLLPAGIVQNVRRRLYAAISPSEILNRLSINPGHARRELKRVLSDLIDGEGPILSKNQKSEIIQRVLHDVLGFGPIEPLLNDSSVSEIMVNGPSRVFAERGGRLYRTDAVFDNKDHLFNLVDRIVSPLGRRIDESSPMVDARLPDGSRVNIIIPPLALDGPVITIRKFKRQVFSFDELIANRTIRPGWDDFLRRAVMNRANILVTGGTGSGKTSMLNALSGLIPQSERIVTIEDAAELRFEQPHVVRLESRPANIEGRGRIGIRELVINALRMRPDRIVVGEVRGSEALDMLQAMNTGHDGSLTTAHANSPNDALARLETMALTGGTNIPAQVIRRQIAGGIDIIVHLVRHSDGSRTVSKIMEVETGQDREVKLRPAGP